MTLTALNKLVRRGGASFPATETFDAPQSLGPFGSYVHRLMYVPEANSSLAFSGGTPVDAASFTVVPSMPTKSGDVYLDPVKGDIYFHSSDYSVTGIIVGYSASHSLVQAADINQILVWSQISPCFIPGIPAPPGSAPYLPPLGSIRIPGGVADTVTITAIELVAADISQIGDGLNTTMRLSPHTNPTTAGYADASFTAYVADTQLVRGWFHTKTVLSTPMEVDVSSSDAYLNIFRSPSSQAGKHANITVALKGI